MIDGTIQKEIRKLLADCVTEGTFWNLHLESGDAIDVWREANRILLEQGHIPVSFDEFYTAIQRFRANYRDSVEAAEKAFLSILEEKVTASGAETGSPESSPSDETGQDDEKKAAAPMPQRRRVPGKDVQEKSLQAPPKGLGLGWVAVPGEANPNTRNPRDLPRSESDAGRLRSPRPGTRHPFTVR
jgi:hypothetical protein